jgi:aldose 1-epimerase
MTGPDPTRIELTDGEARLILAPDVGGGVARLTWRGMEIFRPATARSLTANDALGLGSFPLVPFAGRISEGRFRLAGREVRLPPNLPGETDAIHGQGWRNAWQVAAREQATAALVFDHPAGAWPWDYRAKQTFTLTSNALVQRLSVTNTSLDPMPAGLGVHPYFPRDDETRLRAEVGGVIVSARDPPAPLPPAWDWRGEGLVTEFVDNQFVGWTGAARIVWPRRNLTVAITCDPATPYLVIYAPGGRDHLCVEPVSHRLDAVNRSPGGSDDGMALLEPGQTSSMTVTFTWRALAPLA